MEDAPSAGRKPRRRFSDEFKRDAVHLIIDEKYMDKIEKSVSGRVGRSVSTSA